MNILERIGPNHTKDNIWKIGIHLVANKRTFMTLVSIYLLTMPSATTKTIGLITLAGEYAGFLFEIPSGYISDKIGHKKALILARTGLALGTLMYVYATNKYFFYAAAMLTSIGYAFESGTISAFMHNTLKSLKKEDQYSEIMGKIRSFGFAIPIIFITTLPLLAETHSMKIAFFIAFCIDIIGLLAIILLKEPVQIKETEEIKPTTIKQSLKTFFNLPWIPFIFAGAIIGGLQFGAIGGFKNPYQEFIGFSVSMLGILWATSRIIISQGLFFSGFIKKYVSMKNIILIRGISYGIGLCIAGISTNKWVIAAMFIIITSVWHISNPAYTHHLLEYIKNSNQKATLLSIQSQIIKIISGPMSIVMGYLVSTFHFAYAFIVMGALIFIFTLYFFIRLPHQNKAQTI